MGFVHNKFGIRRAFAHLQNEPSEEFDPIRWEKRQWNPEGQSLNIQGMENSITLFCLIQLIALLEDYLLQALESLYHSFPDKLPSDKKRSITFGEILAAKNRNELIDRIIYEEVRGVKRNIVKMIHQFESFNIMVNESGLIPTLSEVVATRNIWVHRGGRIDKDYHEQSKDYWAMQKEESPELEAIRMIDASYVSMVMFIVIKLLYTLEGKIEKILPNFCYIEGLIGASAPDRIGQYESFFSPGSIIDFENDGLPW